MLDSTRKDTETRITLIGTGTIGLSFAALYLASHLASPSQLTIYDTRTDVAEYVQESLPKFFEDEESSSLPSFAEVKIAKSLEEAVEHASIVQESGPENAPFKINLWAEVEKYAPKDALLWSSTSGIPASQQNCKMQDTSRVLVVHPYNPPHIMPLLELVPSPETSGEVIKRTHEFWRARGRVPIHIKKETTGFVANRLAFALLREAVYLVDQGVVSVEELDQIVQTSMGPRWAVAGPFKSYHAGGGPDGLEGFFKNIGGTVQDCWADSGTPKVGDGWEEKVFRDAKEAYGTVDVAERDRITRRLLQVLEEEKSKTGSAW
ncbi:3-hydroxyacyl-CoA dehydrogenase [Didymella exigua CBS 183.55]|uniref:3-hydroxyacyl-CoA dehydrogenase n=1 Tax=Didymella exigua CBS 183.55 TaxID=1150837 RepID=A0A6A5RTF0_9PLEO|nr:3-hydroxyacyl-CoA dehydrogenase [Didymella exigua CBS 183.55]KAF1931691.1 3-hydroxyacyl-CoA dehydrogenase [Didymella exigua CBS 183.55]